MLSTLFEFYSRETDREYASALLLWRGQVLFLAVMMETTWKETGCCPKCKKMASQPKIHIHLCHPELRRQNNEWSFILFSLRQTSSSAMYVTKSESEWRFNDGFPLASCSKSTT